MEVIDGNRPLHNNRKETIRLIIWFVDAIGEVSGGFIGSSSFVVDGLWKHKSVDRGHKPLRWGLPLNFLNSLIIFTHKELFDRFSN
jgi:hypothetical protein